MLRKNVRLTILSMILLVLGVSLWLQDGFHRFYPVKDRKIPRKHAPPQHERSLLKEYSGRLDIELNPMIEIDFKTQEEIYHIRKKYVFQYPQLVKDEYSPSESVFGQIEDNKPWWGIEGHFYYGSGQKSIEGPSEESRFIVNPYLLVGMIEPYAYTMAGTMDKPFSFPPKPLKLVWSGADSTVKVTYDVTTYFHNLEKYRYFQAKERNLHLVAYNARDFGLNYLYVVPEKSQNIVSANKKKEAISILQFIHCGGSCGYPGGCNNMSPNQNELNIKVGQVPALACIKLWRNKPSSVDQKPDIFYLIEMQ